MKITRKQLQKVISEEVRSYVKNKILSEGKVTNKTIKVTANDLKRIIAEEVSKAKSNRLFEAKDLKALAKSSDKDDRCEAARDPELPEKYIMMLADDPESKVREEIARRPELPNNLLSMLADDPEKKVRDCIGERENLPQAIKKKLGLHENRNLVRATPEMLKRIIAEEARKIRR